MRIKKSFSFAREIVRGTVAVLSTIIACVCLLAVPSAARAEVLFSGGDPRIVYSGRTQLDTNYQYSPDNRRVTFTFVGTEMHIRFTGSTTVRIRPRVMDSTATFAYVLDGTLLKNSDGTVRHDQWLALGGDLTVLTGLATGEHTLIVRSDGDSGPSCWIEAVMLDDGAQLLQANPLPTRKIEFYGDSVTEQAVPIPKIPGTNPDPADEGAWTSSNYYTYGAQVGRKFNADVRWIAKGGMGVKYGFVPFYNLRQVWNKAVLWPTGPVYNLASWQPDVVVVAMGQNDQFNYPTDVPYSQAYQAFVDAYVDQIRDLRGAYPNAVILCMNTTMTGPSFLTGPNDGVPGPFQVIQNDSVLGSDPKIILKTFAQQGFGTHPAGPQHQEMADALTQWISDATGWNTSSSSQSVTGLTLVNADTDQDLGPLTNGSTIDLSQTPHVSIRATTSPSTVGSVRFALDGNGNYRTESNAPCVLAGDSGTGDIYPWNASVGSHTLTATPYTGSGGSGSSGASLTVTFSVVSNSLPAPGVYYLRNKAFNTVLDSEPNGLLVLNSRTGSDDQQWELQAVGDGTYRLKNVRSGRQFLDTEPGNALIWNTGATGDDTRWTLTAVGDGSYRLDNAMPNRDFLLGTGSSQVQWNSGGGGNETHWYFEK